MAAGSLEIQPMPHMELLADAGSEEAAAVAAANNDPNAFAPLYARYLDPIYRYSYRCLGSREAAEDATSLIFTRALAKLATCDERRFRPWLFAIAHNVITDDIRTRQPSTTLDEAAGRIASDPSPEDEALDAEERQSVLALLARLPLDQRRIVALRLSGLSGRETAEVIGKSHGAVKIAQHRAFVRLRGLLGITGESDNGGR